MVASLSACTARREENLNANPVPVPAPAPPKVASPMAPFERMVGGEWRRPTLNLINMFETWQWGPGKHSMVAQTYGTGIDSEPVRNVEVFYWHPGRKQVRLLGLSPFARGVSEGAIRFEGEVAEAHFDLYQTSGQRKMGLRWIFAGPDNYHSVLLEATGPEGLKPMNAWDYVRFKTPTAKPVLAAEAKKPTEHLKAFESLVGHAWEPAGAAEGDGVTADAVHIQTTFEWIPYANAVHWRVVTPTKNAAPKHLLDAYVYHHTGSKALRCLALSNSGSVYEGDVTVLAGGALQFELKGYEGDRVVERVVRLDLEKDETVRDRVWTVEGTPAQRTLVHDVRHQRIEPKED